MSDEPGKSGQEQGLRSFGNYEVAQDDDGHSIVLGEGAFGCTYLARHPLLGKDAAIKVISEAHLHSAKARKGFLSEARHAAQLEHSNIARVLDSGDSGGTLYIVMDYCAGGDLQQLTQRHGPLPAAWLYEILRQTLEALSHAHGHGYVHRDIKPSNIMLASLKLPPVFKLIDFGLTKSLIAEAAPDSLESKFSGTLFFSSPEQLREEEVDGRSDLFSLGMTLWYLAEGKAPLNDRVAALVAERLNEDDYSDMLPSGLPTPMRSLIGRLLRKDREERFQSADEALKRLVKEVGPRVPLPRSHEDWDLSLRTPDGGTEDDPGAGVVAPVELRHVDGGFRGPYGGEGFEEIDSDESLTLGVLSEDPVSGQRVRLMINHLGEGDDGQNLAELARTWAELPCRAVGTVLRIEVFEDAVVLVVAHPAAGLDMLSLLRARGFLRMRDLGGLLEEMARTADAAREAGLGGVDLALHRIFLEFTGEGAPPPDEPTTVPEGPIGSWPESELRLLPWFYPKTAQESSAGEDSLTTLVAGSGDLQQSMVQMFAALTYRLLSGRVPSAASLLSASAFVPVNELSEPANRALAAALANPGSFEQCQALLRALQGGGGEAQATLSTDAQVTVRSGRSASQSTRRRVLGTGVSVSDAVGAGVGKPRGSSGGKARGRLYAALIVLAVLAAGIPAWWMYYEKNWKGTDPAPREASAEQEAAPESPEGETNVAEVPEDEADEPEEEQPPEVPSAYVIRGGIDPPLVSVSVNGSLAGELTPSGVAGIAIPIPDGTSYPVRLLFEAQGHEREELELGPDDSFERGDRFVMQRSTGVVRVRGGEDSGYGMLQFLMLRPLDREPDVARSSSPIQLDLLQRTSLDLPTGIYRATALAPRFPSVTSVRMPDEVRVERGATVSLDLEPELAGQWRSGIPDALPGIPGARHLSWSIADGYTEGLLSAVTQEGTVDLALLDGMRYRMFEGLTGRLDMLADGPFQGRDSMTFSVRRTADGEVRLAFGSSNEAGEEDAGIELERLEQN